MTFISEEEEEVEKKNETQRPKVKGDNNIYTTLVIPAYYKLNLMFNCGTCTANTNGYFCFRLIYRKI